MTAVFSVGSRRGPRGGPARFAARAAFPVPVPVVRVGVAIALSPGGTTPRTLRDMPDAVLSRGMPPDPPDSVSRMSAPPPPVPPLPPPEHPDHEHDQRCAT